MIYRNVLLISLILFAFANVVAEIPQEIGLQGVLDPIPETNPTNVIFTLYESIDNVDGFWTETQSVSFDDNGVFSVSLGSETLINFAFDEQFWIGIKVEDGDEMAPRIPLVSVPYALYAETAKSTTTMEPPVVITYSGEVPTLKAVNEANGEGLRGIGATGVYGQSSSNSGVGVYGDHLPTNNYGYLAGNDYGVYGFSSELGAVYGQFGTTNWGALGTNTYGAKGVYTSNENYGELGTMNAGVYANGTEGYGLSAFTYNSIAAVNADHFRSHNDVQLANQNYAVEANSQEDPTIYGYRNNSEYDQQKGILGANNAGVWGWTNNSSLPAALFEHNLGSYAKLATQEYGVYGSLWGANNYGYLGGYSYGVYGEYDETGNFGYIGGEEEAFYAENGTNNNYVSIAHDDYLFSAESNDGKYRTVMGYEDIAITAVNDFNSAEIANDKYGVFGIGTEAGVCGVQSFSGGIGVYGFGSTGVIGKHTNISNVFGSLAGSNGAGVHAKNEDKTEASLALPNEAFKGSNSISQTSVEICTDSKGAFYASDDVYDNYVYLCRGGNAGYFDGDVSIVGNVSCSNTVSAEIFEASQIVYSNSVITTGNIAVGTWLSVSGITDLEGALNVSGSTDLSALSADNVTISGNCSINGNLSKGSGSFKIDHPLDPENKYLYHSFVESPEMMNIYRGNVLLDSEGKAVVELPEYFETLNIEYSYQLTPVGKPASRLYISQEVKDNMFAIAGGNPGQKISWQVTGVRNDPFARENPIITEVEKEDNNKGKYIHPKAYGKSKDSKVISK